MFRVEAFFESVVHSVNSSFAVVVAIKGVDIRFLDKEKNK